MLYRIRGGLSVRLAGAPVQAVSSGAEIGRVAVYGADYPGMRTELLVDQGDRVTAGQPLFRDRKRPEIRIVSPVAGRVARIDIGAKRRLSVLEVAVEGSEHAAFDVPEDRTRESVAALLQEAGLWPAFLARPFGRIPDPEASPDAIFVTAIDTEPLAADPALVMEPLPIREAFEAGLAAIGALTDGPVVLCQAPGLDLARAQDGLRIEKFEGRHPAGLPGTHIDRVMPVGPGRTVWQVHYQDVVAVGHLLQHGRIDGERVVALAGPGVRAPRLLSIPQGAALDDLVEGELTEGPKTVLSGSPLSGRDASHLRRRHWQVTVLPRRARPAPRGPSWFRNHNHPARPRAAIPTAALEAALGPDLPVVPLVRALAAHDVDAAETLGAAGLLEDDMALLSYAAAGTEDYGALLRETLDALEARA